MPTYFVVVLNLHPARVRRLTRLSRRFYVGVIILLKLFITFLALINTILPCLVPSIVIYVRSYRRLSHVLGPQTWGLSVFPLFWFHAQGGIYDKFGDLNRKYGPPVRIAPNTLLTSDPDVLRRMSAARSLYARSDWYIAMRLNPGQNNVLSTRDEKKHDDLRRRMTAGCSGKENISLEQDIDDCVLDLVSLIETKYLSTEWEKSSRLHVT